MNNIPIIKKIIANVLTKGLYVESAIENNKLHPAIPIPAAVVFAIKLSI